MNYNYQQSFYIAQSHQLTQLRCNDVLQLLNVPLCVQVDRQRSSIGCLDEYRQIIGDLLASKVE